MVAANIASGVRGLHPAEPLAGEIQFGYVKGHEPPIFQRLASHLPAQLSLKCLPLGLAAIRPATFLQSAKAAKSTNGHKVTPAF